MNTPDNIVRKIRLIIDCTPEIIKSKKDFAIYISKDAMRTLIEDGAREPLEVGGFPIKVMNTPDERITEYG